MHIFKQTIRRMFLKFGLEVSYSKGESKLTGVLRTSSKAHPRLFSSKFQISDVETAFSLVRKKWANHNIVLLIDREIESLSKPFSMVRCDQRPVDEIHKYDIRKTIFVYACDSDSTGLPFVKELVDRKGVFYPLQVYTPSSYANVDDMARNTIESQFLEQTEAGFCKFDFGPGDSLNLIQAISATLNVPGDYLEIGCYRGSSACVALAYMKESRVRRRCFFLDVFEGFTYQAAKDSADAMWEGTHATEGLEIVNQRIQVHCDPEAGLTADVVKANIIEDELPAQMGEVALANIDVDLYEAVFAALIKVAPKMAVGGVIVVEDPGHTPALIGSRLALSEFLKTQVASSFTSIYLESGQTFLIRVLKHQ